MNIVFLDSDTIGNDIDLSPISNLGNFTSYKNTKKEDIIGRLADAEIAIVNKIIITKEIIDTCPKLKLICVAATGMNNIDIEYASQKNIPVRNAVNYSTNSVVQVTFGILLEIINKTSKYNEFVKSGKYSQREMFTCLDFPFGEISGKRYGIIGMGNIGKKVAQIAKAFGAEVCYYSTSGQNNSGTEYTQLSLDELLITCDIISIHAPLNAQTNNLITISELKKMKNTAILVNVGRGGIVNEIDLANAIDSNIIAFAGVDVYATEPISENHPYLQIKNKENLILTPHVAWASIEARKCLVEKIAKNITDFINE
jgi:Lactate dehydrogenase and related dehydrogenases